MLKVCDKKMNYQMVNILPTKKIRFKILILWSDLYDYGVAYIIAKGTIDLLAAATNENDNSEKDVMFKKNTPVRSCIPKINSTLITQWKILI